MWQKINQNLHLNCCFLLRNSSKVWWGRSLGFPSCGWDWRTPSRRVSGCGGTGRTSSTTCRKSGSLTLSSKKDTWTNVPVSSTIVQYNILSYEDSYYLHKCTPLQLRRYSFVNIKHLWNNICVYWWLYTFKMYKKTFIQNDFIVILIVQNNNTTKMAYNSLLLGRTQYEKSNICKKVR